MTSQPGAAGPSEVLVARQRRLRWALRGLAAGTLGLAVATVIAVVISALGLTGGTPSPALAVGAAFVDATPPWLKDFAVATFGTADKAALFVGMAVVLAAVFAGLGLLARTRPGWAQAGMALVAGVALWAVLSRPSSGPLDAVPTVAGGVVSVWSLRSAATRRRGPTRRSVIELAASLLALGIFAPVSGRGGTAATSSRDAVSLPTEGPPPAVGDADLQIAGVTPWVVPNADFYRIDTALVVPRLVADDWSLRVWGEVDREVTITWAQLLAKPLVQRHTTLSCVSNEVGGSLVGNALWLGWPVRELLAQAGPRAGADMVLSRSADGWTAGTPLSVLTDGRDALLAVGMNGEPLPFEHGFPVRLVVPGLYGYVSATKWVTELKVTRFAVDQGYWTPRGWSALAPVKTQSRIDVPRAGARVSAGTVAVAGVAWAMHRGITGVQVRVDEQAWVDARLAGEPTADSWRQWVYEWDASPGSHTLTVRARDTTGEWQTDQLAPPPPDGATGYHSVVVRVG
ncbi:MAG: molybdopterin-dependent oxidoreductase [Dermatophilaceae bacterium]